MIGFSMFGFVSAYWLFAWAIVVSTIRGILCFAAALGYFGLHLRLGRQRLFVIASPADEQPVTA